MITAIGIVGAIVVCIVVFLQTCASGKLRTDLHYTTSHNVRERFEVFAYVSGFHRCNVYAYTLCDGVTNVESSKDTPLSLYYTTNDQPDKQGDLLIAVQPSYRVRENAVELNFSHALSKLSFVWQANEEGDTVTAYKLHKIVVRGKQSGTLTFSNDSNEPVWTLDARQGDHHFLIYECPDNAQPDAQQTYFNPEDALLRHVHSLFLVPGVAVAADIEYSEWKHGKLVARHNAQNIILGGREHMAAYLLANKHYTYTFHPSASDANPVDVTLDTNDWSTEDAF
mgnify:CR=1 FL=1